MSDSYLSLKFGQERNVEALGAYVAWLITNNLLNHVLEQSAATAVARVKMQDLTGAEFLTTVLHGELKAEHLNEEGNAFCEHYLVGGQYEKDLSTCEYDGENEWHFYDEISPMISAAFHAFNQPPLKKIAAKIIQFPLRRK